MFMPPRMCATLRPSSATSWLPMLPAVRSKKLTTGGPGASKGAGSSLAVSSRIVTATGAKLLFTEKTGHPASSSIWGVPDRVSSWGAWRVRSVFTPRTGAAPASASARFKCHGFSGFELELDSPSSVA